MLHSQLMLVSTAATVGVKFSSRWQRIKSKLVCHLSASGTVQTHCTVVHAHHSASLKKTTFSFGFELYMHYFLWYAFFAIICNIFIHRHGYKLFLFVCILIACFHSEFFSEDLNSELGPSGQKYIKLKKKKIERTLFLRAEADTNQQIYKQCKLKSIDLSHELFYIILQTSIHNKYKLKSYFFGMHFI